jgi:hypothetical protein
MVAAVVGWTSLDGAKVPDTLLLQLVLCNDCAREAANEKNELPAEAYALHPWVDPLVQVGYEMMVLQPDHP